MLNVYVICLLLIVINNDYFLKLSALYRQILNIQYICNSKHFVIKKNEFEQGYNK